MLPGDVLPQDLPSSEALPDLPSPKVSDVLRGDVLRGDVLPGGGRGGAG